MTHHVPVSHPAYYAAHRSRLIGGLGGKVRRLGDLTEFLTPTGEVLCRKVVAGGVTECWLRADLADAAAEFLIREEHEAARVAAEIIALSLGRDADRAREQGVSLEQYRQHRNHALARIDARRGVNSRGL